METWLIWTVIIGIAFGFLIGSLYALQKNLREKSQRLESAQIELRTALEFKAIADRVYELDREVAELRQENTQLLAQIAELKKESGAGKERLFWLEREKEHLHDAFRALVSLQGDADRVIEHLEKIIEEIEEKYGKKEKPL